LPTWKRYWPHSLAGVVLVAATWRTFAWSLSPEHFFLADDWGWLYRSAFLPLSQYVSLWPGAIYNDRPAGALLITAAYRLFGLDPVAFHRLWLALHLVNVLLVYALGVRLFRPAALAFAAAYAFGNWGASTAAPTWVASVFDLAATTFVLASILSFLSDRAIVRGLSPVFFFLAMRTKENTLLLPVFLLVLLLLRVPPDRWRAEGRRRLRWHFLLLALLAATYGYFYLAGYSGRDVPHDPYHLRFDLFTLAAGGSYYFHAMLYRASRLPLPVLAAGAALLAALAARRKGQMVLAGAAGFVLFLLPVIFLVNHRDVLYLYLPAVFFAVALAGLAQAVSELLPWPRVRGPLAAALALGCFLALPHGRVHRERERAVLADAAFAKENLEQVRRRFPTLPPGTKFVFVGLPAHFNAFDYGPCHSLKIAYRDPTLSCVLVDAGAPVPPGHENAIRAVLRAGRLEFGWRPIP
jgi:hypothetical protein